MHSQELTFRKEKKCFLKDVKIYQEKHKLGFKVLHPKAWSSPSDKKLAAAARTKVNAAGKVVNLRDMAISMKREFLQILKMKYEITVPPDFDMGKVV